MFTRAEIKKLDDRLHHPCTLPETENILIRYIDSGYFVDCRRKFQRFITCSELNPRSKLFLKSTAAIELEKSNHLHNYYHMIHPFSMGRVYWEIFMMVILLVLLVYIPVDICITITTNFKRAPRIVLDAICIIDIIISFFTGYQHPLTKKVIMNQKMVAKNYLKSWFVLDFISSLNGDVLIMIFNLEEYWYIKVPSFLKIFRLATLLKYLDRFREWKQYSLYRFKMVKLAIIMAILLIWNSSFLYLMARSQEEKWLPPPENVDDTWEGLRICFFRILLNFLLVSHGERNSKSTIIIVSEMIWLTVGFILQLAVTGQIVQIVLKYSSLNDKYYQMVQQFQEYMKSKNLPESVCKRVLDYFEFRFQRNYYKENAILNSLSNKLRQEIVGHTGKELLLKTDIFKNLPSHLLTRISYKMTMEIFLPNDTVVTYGNKAESMYFILTGMVAIFNREGKEVCHLADGSYFGEVALFMENQTRQASVVAIDFCEMYTLHNSYFVEAISPYPDLMERIQLYAHTRIEGFKEEEDEAKDNVSYKHAELEFDEDSRTRMYYKV